MTPLNLKIDRSTLSIVYLIALAGMFLFGRYSVSDPPREEVCKQEIRDLGVAEGAIAQLESDLGVQKDLLTRCEDSCDARLRGHIDKKDVERKAAVVEAKKSRKLDI